MIFGVIEFETAIGVLACIGLLVISFALRVMFDDKKTFSFTFIGFIKWLSEDGSEAAKREVAKHLSSVDVDKDEKVE